MINRIEINGFRSLSNFTLQLKPGLNAMVGPNGSGKTNIIDAISFIGDVISTDPTIAIQKYGGVAGVFRRTSENEYVKKMQFLIHGHIGIRRKDRKTSGSKTDRDALAFEYSFDIKLDKNMRPALANQHLEIANLTSATAIKSKDKRTKAILAAVEHLSLDIKQTGKYKYAVKAANDSEIGPVTFSSKESDSDFSDFLESQLNSSHWGKIDLLTRLSPFMYTANLIIDILSDVRTLAVRPAQIRKGDDTSEFPSTRGNGRGLAATIYALENATIPGWTKNKCSQVLDSINDELSLAVPSICGVTTKIDHATSMIQLEFKIDTNKDTPLSLPAISVSDGTIKWLAIATCLATSGSFAIEEPENFLHPWMQTELVRLLRENSNKQSCYLLTTHSESLLNALKPSEIIICNYVDGKTTAVRLDNEDEIHAEIERTGFGLGFYYLSGSLV